MMKRYICISFITTLLLFLGMTQLMAQVEFELSPLDLPISRFSMGFSDVNGDFRDDIVLNAGGRKVYLLIQTENMGMQTADTIELEGTNDWSLAILDRDNNGVRELVTSGYYSGTNLIDFSNTVNFESQIEYIEQGAIFAQNANTIDLNNDGFIDYFVCHDDGDSHMYLNDGTGTFIKDNSMFNFVTEPVSDGSGNYGSIWDDIDGDGDIDLYIAKCRNVANFPTDPRRINQLHLNNGDGTFTESAKAFGLASGEQSWAADFADVDNDGDLDCYIVEHTGDYMLYENVDNVFEPRPDYISEPIQGGGFQGFFTDMDNDGLVDIIIAGDDDYILWNKGDLKFEKNDIVIPGDRELASLALGDANMDGFTDFVATYSFSTNSDVPSVLWINKGNSNNYLKVSLVGVQSNRDGVGAKINSFSQLGRQTRTVTSGEGYGIVNSLTQSFGLADDTKIDSLEIIWPSGQIDTYYNLAKNSHYIITEGTCINSLEDSSYLSYSNFYCQDQTAHIVNETETNWNTGEIETSLTVENPGFYFGIATDAMDCVQPFPTIFIEQTEELQAFVSAKNNIACFGDELLLSTGLSQEVTWSTGDVETELLVDQTGYYSYIVEGNCGDVQSDEVFLEFLEPPFIEDQNIQSSQGEDVEIMVPGDDVRWYTQDDLQTPFHLGNQLLISDIASSVSYKVQNTIRSETLEKEVGLTEVSREYSGTNINAGLYFNVLNDVLIESVKIYTDSIGLRVIEILNADEEVVQSKEVEITIAGEQYIQLDFLLPPGEGYFIRTNEDSNFANFGHRSPLFTRSTELDGYPFIADKLLEITDSFFGSDFYYYFYDWQLSRHPIECQSNLATVEVDVELSAVNDQELLNSLSVFPVPASNWLQVHSEAVRMAKAELYDMQGHLVLEKEISDYKTTFSIEELAKGMYILKIISDSGKNAFLKIPCINR